MDRRNAQTDMQPPLGKIGANELIGNVSLVKPMIALGKRHAGMSLSRMNAAIDLTGRSAIRQEPVKIPFEHPGAA
jgi:hypothetical protein